MPIRLKQTGKIWNYIQKPHGNHKSKKQTNTKAYKKLYKEQRNPNKALKRNSKSQRKKSRENKQRSINATKKIMIKNGNKYILITNYFKCKLINAFKKRQTVFRWIKTHDPLHAANRRLISNPKIHTD